MKSKNKVVDILNRAWKSLLLPAIVFLAFTLILGEDFLNSRLLLTIARQTAMPILLAFSMALMMFMGMMNFAMGAVLYTAVILGSYLAQAMGGGIPLIFVFTVIFAIIFMAINGWLYNLLKVPCIVLDVDMEESSLLAMVENLQRQDLDFLEEARGMANLMRMYGLSQEDCARRLGRSQSAVANKLRLLKLPEDVLEALRQNGLTERHGRALLRLGDDAARRAALAHILEAGLNVAQTDAYIDALLAPAAEKPRRGRRRALILKDVRVFLNGLSRSLDVMKQGGIDAEFKKEETDEALVVTISIPKKRS